MWVLTTSFVGKRGNKSRSQRGGWASRSKELRAQCRQGKQQITSGAFRVKTGGEELEGPCWGEEVWLALLGFESELPPAPPGLSFISMSPRTWRCSLRPWGP